MSGYNSTTSGGNPGRTASSEPEPHTDEQAQQQGRPAESGEHLPKEFGGRRKGLEPTRYGDWEKDGRCIDF